MTTDDKSASTGFDRDARLRDRLRALAVDNPPAHPPAASDELFREALHRRLMAEPPPRPIGLRWRAWAWLEERQRWLWPVVGLAAGAAAYALLVVAHGNPLRPSATNGHAPLAQIAEVRAAPDALPSFRIPASKVAVIKLAFSAEVAVEDVTFQVTLPEGLCFWSGGQRLTERSFRWPGRLEAGENLVPIAVRGDRPGRYPVLAAVEVGGRVLEQRVVMDVRAEGT